MDTNIIQIRLLCRSEDFNYVYPVCNNDNKDGIVLEQFQMDPVGLYGVFVEFGCC